VTAAGTFMPNAPEIITPSGGAFVVNMPFASAAVVVVTTK
jgi:hypothetical protein